ncbi:NAD(P)H-quinone oxidoreductase [Enterococcus mundtii]|uniref:Zinc-containing alcohol dehydrogenase n=1 Tax=Enterococcus mundtii TaxID=53346 RepID=A0AAI8R7U2_ENTMU|nr:NAD(P)H-quinone oxidoreductase [Enterococcus mundtii]QCJ57062.1 NAD(P)H-quinone oxidoreductase [Enterococcus mundtii]BAO07666.1 alcohol dehydrogenase [Enterococcus mundtii QU 25]BBM14000.1 zinc-containing alcohol dehydrogenase [Enterococcus mundtii]
MRGISMKHPGSADVLTEVDVPRPIPKAGELLLKVHTAAVNRTDIMRRENTALQAPYPILGVEVAGEVIENASDRSEFSTGTRVYGLVNLGGYAEYAVIPADRAILLPDSLDYVSAAGIAEVFLTAYQTLYWLGKLQKNETVLIHAGASGVGTAAIQLAKQYSQARIIVTAGSAEKLAFCQELGADEVINYKTQDFAEEVKKITDGHGVDVILDFIGASYWEKNLASIAVDGRWVLIGTLGGTTVESLDLSVLLQKRIQLIGTLLTPRSDEYKAKLTQEFMKNIDPYFETGAIRPIIDRTFTLSEAKEAHEYMEANKNVGKIILTVSET